MGSGMRIEARKQREITRLVLETALSSREISRSVHVSPNTIEKIRRLAKIGALTWAQLKDLDDTAFQCAIEPPTSNGDGAKPVPDWMHIRAELQKPDMTLQLLWQEWKGVHPDGMSYSQFTLKFRKFERTINISMRQVRRAGEKLFLDFAGRTVSITDPASGQTRNAQIFVAAMAASSKAFAMACESQSTGNWIACCVAALNFYQGAPAIMVPDNLKAAVIRNKKDQITLNASFAEFGEHYGTVVIPARVRRPRDKATAEVTVKLVQRFVLAPLRNRTFFSIAELNAEIGKLVARLNAKPFSKLPGSRNSIFECVDAPALKPLPATPYTFAELRVKVRVGLDYHFEHKRHHYSVPHALRNREVDLRITSRVIEVLFRNKRVVVHELSSVEGGTTTLREHLPSSHAKYLDGEPAALLAWAESAGPNIHRVIRYHLKERRDIANGVRAAFALKSDCTIYGVERFESVCKYALRINSQTIQSIRSILKTQADQRSLPAPPAIPAQPHENIRGGDYFDDGGKYADAADDNETK